MIGATSGSLPSSGIPAKSFSYASVPWAKGGVLDCSGGYIEESASFAMNSNKVNEGVQTRLYGAYPYEHEEIETYNDNMVLYAGFYIQQWGHFLLECISRLYPIVQNPEKYKDMKIIFLPMRENDEINGTFLELLNLIGIRDEQIVILREPTRYKKIIVPEQSLNMNIFGTKEYETIINCIVEKAIEKPVKIKTHKKIYLSRKNWSLSIGRDIGEEKIEKFFNQNGFKSVSMEQYSLVEQIHILQGADHVASAICTLPHNLIFARDGIKSTIINKMPHYNVSQFQIDEFRNLDATYIDAYSGIFLTDIGGGPFLFDVNENLINYAKDNGMKLSKQEARGKDIIKYLDLCFEKIEDFTDEELFVFRNLYKIMRSRFQLYSNYSKRELMVKKYFHKIMWKLSLGKKNFHLEKYIKYKMKLNKMKEMYYQ